jgi:hypothetical protein
MNVQIPAEGILKRGDWGDAKCYVVPCSCGDNSHTHDVWIEAEDTGVSVTTSTKLKSKWWSMNRLHVIWTLLTKGYVEYESTTIMTAQQAINYAETLKSAIKDVEEFKKANNVKN